MNQHPSNSPSSTLQNSDQEEQYNEDDFFGLNVQDHAPDQVDNEFIYLDDADRQESTTGESIEWRDCLISNEDEEVTFLLDNSVKRAWHDYKEDANHV